jgi:hypothetical protein
VGSFPTHTAYAAKSGEQEVRYHSNNNQQTKNNATIPSSSSSSLIPPYRSIIIEKHTNFSSSQPLLSNTNNEFVKYKTTKVQYTPPAQPSSVLNTIITTN